MSAKIVKEIVKAVAKPAAKKTTKGRKRGRKSAAFRAERAAKQKESRQKLAGKRGPQHRGQKLLKTEAAKPKLTLGQKLKREKGKADTSGLSAEQKKERSSLVARIIREQRAANKSGSSSGGVRKQTLNKEGIRLVEKGDSASIEKIIKNPKKYMYEGADAPLISKDAGTEFATRKDAREAFKEMSKSEKIEYIQKNFTPKMTSRQISDVLGQGKGEPKLPKQQNIASIVRKLKRQGYPSSLSKLKEAQKKRSLGVKSRGPVGRMGTTTAPSRKKKGGKVGTKRRGCGAALRGFGKAMK